MQIETAEVMISTSDGQMPACLCRPAGPDRKPAILLLMEAFGLTSHIREVATRIANEGYVVLSPNLYHREPLPNTFDYDEVERAMAMMWRLDFGQPVEDDLEAAMAYLASRPDVDSERIGVTGFCLGGGLTFLTSCRFSNRIVAAAPFYGMVLDEWIEAVKDITVPMYLFFGGTDPFISRDRIRQIDARFKQLGKEYRLKVYPDATHGFFCHERSSYNQAAAEDAWRELIQFFHARLSK